MGSRRDSRTFQVGTLILVPRRALGLSSSGAGGRGESATMGDGGNSEKNAVSET
jgi:hypothetical protein